MNLPGEGLFAPFSRTRRLILAARLRRDAGFIVAVVALLGGWFAWLVAGRIALYVSSQQTRLESEKLPIHVEVPVEGVVAECGLELGRIVKEGDLLVRLDARAFELQRQELDAELKADHVAIEALTRQLDAESQARDAVAELAQKTARAGSAKVAASRTSSLYKEKETAITRKLHGAELASELEMLRANGEAASMRAQETVAAAQAALDSSSGRVNVSDREAQIAALQRTLADARSLSDVHAARLQSAIYEIERRSVRATAAGTLEDITACTPGLDLATGQILATLLPQSELHVVSLFRPEDAVGRVWHGQSARVRIDNFPWTQYGSVEAVVDRVGSEPRAGLVRVELRVVRPNPSFTLVHGLTGLTEIEVEKTSPFLLLLRMGGQLLYPKAAATQSAEPAGGVGG